jgi:poly(A) polymerase
MFRAVAFAARLGFTMDRPVVEGIRACRHLLTNAAPARLIEEYYKVLRSGSAEATFRLLAAHGLLETITPELHRGTGTDALWHALADLDRYRQRFETVPDALTNPILLGTLLVPLGLMPRRSAAAESLTDIDEVETDDEHGDDEGNRIEPRRRGADDWRRRRERRRPKEPQLHIGMLPVARRDTERLRQILSVQRRLMDLESTPRTKRVLMHRGPFQEALVWLEVHGRSPEALEHWRGFIEATAAYQPAETTGTPEEGAPRRRRRRGRRRGWRQE